MFKSATSKVQMASSSYVPKVCGNCEERNADVQCTSCKDEDSLFCKSCWDVHVKVKQFRDHLNIDLTQRILCCNCDTMDAVAQCIQCDAPNTYFCSDCWTTHAKVKAYRHHTMKPHVSSPRHKRDVGTKRPYRVEPLEVSVSEDMASTILDSCFNFFVRTVDYLNLSFADTTCAQGSIPASQPTNWIVESINDITNSRDMDAKTIVFGFAVAFVVHLVVKLLLGKNSIFVMLAVGMFGVRWLRRKQHVTVTEINALKSVGALSQCWSR